MSRKISVVIDYFTTFVVVMVAWLTAILPFVLNNAVPLVKTIILINGIIVLFNSLIMGLCKKTENWRNAIIPGLLMGVVTILFFIKTNLSLLDHSILVGLSIIGYITFTRYVNKFGLMLSK